ncbi:MAG: hypothetical protein MUP66_00770 [Candidatus Nanohaloarchaeota archaeon QJJ-5]|nr:hypothetical protein [Candidatus Nanohaloarchaeota archaeon QJJ-5]
MDYYDKLLLGIFISLVGSVGFGVLSAVPLTVSAAVAAVIGVGGMYQGMFLRAPTGQHPGPDSV